ncbi:unnamed protein product [Mycena citricolor]|uniref:Uncharacterized protein n=1 Tax=Mycena citricolor TaxID=2018698 RepID=A0AAD2HZ87_9AGAR|nr:unnamed protein product [Mycena citricolor]
MQRKTTQGAQGDCRRPEELPEPEVARAEDDSGRALSDVGDGVGADSADEDNDDEEEEAKVDDVDAEDADSVDRFCLNGVTQASQHNAGSTHLR